MVELTTESYNYVGLICIISHIRTQFSFNREKLNVCESNKLHKLHTEVKSGKLWVQSINIRFDEYVSPWVML